MMESNRTHRVDPELVEIVPQHRHQSDPHLWGNGDPHAWEHEVRSAAPTRARAGQGKAVAAVIAVGVFLGTGFAIGAPVYALSRWWANRPVATAATATLETKSPVVAQGASEPPANEASLPSDAARSAGAPDEDAMLGAIAGDAGPADAGVPDAMTQEAVAVAEPQEAALVSEPPPMGPLQSESPVVVPPLVEPVPVESFAMDPVRVESFAMDSVPVESFAMESVAVESFALDPVAIDRVTIDPVPIDRVTIDPVQINVPEVDGEQRAAR